MLTELHTAAINNNLKKVKSIVKRFLNPNGIPVDAVTQHGYTPLHYAAGLGHYGLVVSLVSEFNANVNLVDFEGETPLHRASAMGHEKIVNYLVQRGADLTLRNIDDKTADDLRLRNSYQEKTSKRFERRLTYEQEKQLTIRKEFIATLCLAAGSGQLAKVITYFPNRALVEQCDDAGMTILHYASAFGHLELVSFLVEKLGANPLQAGKFNRLAIHWAASKQYVDVVTYFVTKCHVSLYEEDQNHNTAAKMLRINLDNHSELSRYVTPQAKSNVNKTPTLHKSDIHYDEPSSVINRYGLIRKNWRALTKDHLKNFSIDTKDEYGWTLLHCATFDERYAVIEFLIMVGNADPTIKNKDGNTSYDLAWREQTKYFILDLILKKAKQHVIKQEYTLAEKYFQQVSTLNQHYSSIWYEKGLMFRKRGYLSSALQEFFQCWIYNEHRIDAIQRRVEIFLELNELETAIECVEKFLFRVPGNIDAIRSKFWMFLYQKQYGSAETYCNNLIIKYPQFHDELYRLIAFVCLQQKQIGRAQFNLALIVNPSPYKLQLEAFIDYFNLDTDSCKKKLADAVGQLAENKSRLAQLFFERGIFYHARENVRNAMLGYEQAQFHNPEQFLITHFIQQLKQLETKRESVKQLLPPNQTVDVKPLEVAKPIVKENPDVQQKSPEPTNQNDSSFLMIKETELQFNRAIADGACGQVFRGTWKEKEVAIKRLKEMKTSEQYLEDFKRELAIMAKVRHPNIVDVLGGSDSLYGYCIVMEYMPDGTLYQLLHSGVLLTLDELTKIAIDIGHGLDHLHQNNVIHRDLKSVNILVKKEQVTEKQYSYTIKLCDFGLSKIKRDDDSSVSSHFVGTPAWTAPEVFQENKYSNASDVFSYGMVLWELLTREKPFKNVPSYRIAIEIIERDKPEVIPTNSPEPWPKAINACWDKDPKARPSVVTVVSFFKEHREPISLLSNSNSYTPIKSLGI